MDVGEWVEPGMPVFEMVDISSTTVRVDLPERYFGRLAIGSEVLISRTGTDLPHLKGTVVGIAPNASEETHTFPVIVDVPNSDGALGGGMLVRATLSLDNSYTSLAIPKDAVIRQGSQTIVYTVQDGKASPVPIVTTSSNGKVVAIVSENLSSGMTVIVRGNERVFPGTAVQVPQNPSQQDDGKSEKPSEQASVTD